ncbi:MAG TPA: hypothetical protein VGH33_05510 [Isosphaeraceae bacterium]
MAAPPDLRTVLVPALLAVAAIALVLPWNRAATGLAALAVLAAYGLTCWGLGRSSAPEAETPDLAALLDRLDRIAVALESPPAIQTERFDGFATMAAAIAEGRWADAEAMLAEHPDHPDAPRYSHQFASARQAAGDAMREELKAAQEVNDPDRVLEIHAGLAAVLTAEALADLDGKVLKWFLALIMRRLRGGTVRPDVADLAARVAERFPRSVEGASLRASLATLRRSAGLCPRCAKPYRGIAEACPVCLASAQAAAENGVVAVVPWAEESPVDPEPSPEPSPGGLDHPLFLDDPT